MIRHFHIMIYISFFIPRTKGIPKLVKNPQTDIQIINLSQRQLNKTDIKLLEKGLKFTPTPRTSNIEELTKDVSEFTRKVRLIEYFDDKEDDNESLVKNKSNFVPPRGREELLDNFVLRTINIPLEPIEKSKRQTKYLQIRTSSYYNLGERSNYSNKASR